MERLSLSDYDILTGDLTEALSTWLSERSYPQLIVLVDENTRRHCYPRLAPLLSTYAHTLLEIPAGEKYKNLDTCRLIWEGMMKANAGRSDLCINLGGGVIGDMGGFCAATFKRGMDFIQIPTTLLSQVDASIGGKLGIDFMQVKNSIGLFGNPGAVFIDPTFLRTLPLRELRSGLAEIIKHSLIQDEEQWDALRSLNDLQNIDWQSLIVPSLRIKQQIVADDPFENGLRKALNFGHTIGHAVEGYALETRTPLLHGEAIAVGMLAESYLSHRLAGLPQHQLQEITQSLLRIYQPQPLNPDSFPALLALMANDKKNRGKAINFSLLPRIGSVQVDQIVAADLIQESLHYFNSVSS